MQPSWYGGTESEIVGQGSGRCVDIQDPGTADRAPVQLWECGGGANQKCEQAGGALVNPQSGKCLDAANQGIANGTRLQIWDCYGNGTQTNSDPARRRPRPGDHSLGPSCPWRAGGSHSTKETIASSRRMVLLGGFFGKIPSYRHSPYPNTRSRTFDRPGGG
ncbi:MAG: RICIN domain-containing protein [Actinoallomurus sp.]